MEQILSSFKNLGIGCKIVMLNMQGSLACIPPDDWDNYLKKLKGVLLTFKKIDLNHHKSLWWGNMPFCWSLCILEKLIGVLFLKLTLTQMFCTYLGYVFGYLLGVLESELGENECYKLLKTLLYCYTIICRVVVRHPFPSVLLSTVSVSHD